MRFYIYSYNTGSQGAKNLATELNCKIIRHKNSKYFARPTDIVINWGSHSVSGNCSRAIIINNPSKVSVNANKLSCFKLWQGKVSVPEWTTDKKIAASWKSSVVCRHLLTSHSGNGIEIVEAGENIPNAPLYTKYIKKQSEYRVHIVRGEVIDLQRKIRDPDREPTNWQVRSHDNGFIYVRNNLQAPKSVTEEAMKAFKASGLDFGAFDVIVDKFQKSYVLEVNCAPGIEGVTVTNYANAFRRIIHDGR